MAGEFSVTIEGDVKVLEALGAVSKEANFAQKTAIRAAARKGRSIVARELASRHKVPMKLFRKRVRFFLPRAERGERATARLWTGLRKGLRAGEHPRVAAQLRSAFPRGFAQTMGNGRQGWWHRLQPTRPFGPGARQKKNSRARGNTPIEEHEIDISRGTRGLMIDTARKVMRTVYPDVLRRDYLRRIDKIRRRAQR